MVIYYNEFQESECYSSMTILDSVIFSTIILWLKQKLSKFVKLLSFKSKITYNIVT